MRSTLMALALLTLGTGTANAATILQDQADVGLGVFAFAPIGQSFTTVEADVQTIGFGFESGYLGAAPADLLMSVYEGSGAGGTLLGSVSRTFTGPGGYSGDFFDFDVSGLTFGVGSLYTALVTATGAGAGGIVFGVALGDLYAGGTAFTGGNASPNGIDARFRVVSVAPVPLPAAAWLLLGALGGLGVLSRRRRAPTTQGTQATAA